MGRGASDGMGAAVPADTANRLPLRFLFPLSPFPPQKPLICKLGYGLQYLHQTTRLVVDM